MFGEQHFNINMTQSTDNTLGLFRVSGVGSSVPISFSILSFYYCATLMLFYTTTLLDVTFYIFTSYCNLLFSSVTMTSIISYLK